MLTNLELEQYKKRIIEIQEESKICAKNRDFKKLMKLGIELSKIQKTLKKATKMAKKGGI